MRVGITGHMDLAEDCTDLVREAIDRTLPEQGPDLIGVSCMAYGADWIFAEAVLAAGGRLEVVLPAADYRETKVWRSHHEHFDAIIARATTVDVMPFELSDPEAYAAANERMIASIDALLAVWDGKPAKRRGGTADAVAQAERRGVPVTRIWPEGAKRDNGVLGQRRLSARDQPVLRRPAAIPFTVISKARFSCGSTSPSAPPSER